MSIHSVFLIDDDEDEHFFFATALEKANGQIAFGGACSGHEGLQKLAAATQLPDIIFIDINMRPIDGFETLQLLKSIDRYKNIHTVIYSTAREDIYKQRAIDLGADRYLEKPYNVTEFSLFIIKYLASF